MGSGTGLQDIGENLVDFGASDAPLSADTTPCDTCFQIPWALTATGVAWNVPGVHKLRLTGKILAEIYLGQIKNWDSSQIKKLNKHERFPNLQITPFHRLDGSGDSYAFTDYLSKVNSTWKREIGRGTKPAFPVGPGADKNSGMVQPIPAETFGITRGGIAYIAVTYLIAHRIAAASIKNAAGNYEVPNFKNIANAAKGVRIPGNRELHIVDPSKKDKIAYPISTFTYVMMKSTDPLGNGPELRSFVSWAVTTGQSFSEPLDFVPLPKNIVKVDKRALSLIH